MNSRRAVVIAIDQGTSATKAVVMDQHGAILRRVSIGLSQNHPQPGWVEQDAEAVRDSVVSAVTQCIAGLDASVVSVGLSTQRESSLIWDRLTGKPLGPVLGWQDRRTSTRAQDLQRQGHGDMVRASTGLPLDPMFSAMKFEYLLDEVDPRRMLSREGRIAVGTMDSWLMYSLTGEHRIEAGNASRTQLLNLGSVGWDPELLDLFNIPFQVLPDVFASTASSTPIRGIPGMEGVRINAVMGDSHSALYAHGVRHPGQVKVTYGTGSSVMGISAEHGGRNPTDGSLVRTIAWSDSAPVYAFEGNILATGATIRWAAQLLGMDVPHLDALAQSVNGSQGVNLIPAFAGLGAPWWDDSAEALISGFNLGTSQAHLARAAFESIPLQIEDVLEAAEREGSLEIDAVLVDGGPTANSWLMQMQADISQRRISRSMIPDLSALGVAHMAAVESNLCSSAEVGALESQHTDFFPQLEPDQMQIRRGSWMKAMSKARSTTQHLRFATPQSLSTVNEDHLVSSSTSEE